MVNQSGVKTLPRINSGEFDPRELVGEVNGCSDELVAATFGDLPDEDFYDDDENGDPGDRDGGKKTQRSWLGKVGKGLYRRTIGGKKPNKDSAGDGRDDADVRAMVLACRSPMASVSGGVACQSAEDMKVCRSVLSLMVRQMGRNLLTGGNVMNVSFPIQCCQPKTTLEIGCAVSAPPPPPSPAVCGDVCWHVRRDVLACITLFLAVSCCAFVHVHSRAWVCAYMRWQSSSSMCRPDLRRGTG